MPNKRPCTTPSVSRDVTCAVVCTYGCDGGRISPTRCAVIDAALGGRESPHRAYRTPRAAAGSVRSVLVGGSGLASPADLGGFLRSKTTLRSRTRPCGDASLARCALGTRPCPLPPCPFESSPRCRRPL